MKEIVELSPIPIIADIHFNYKRGIEAIEAGVHCIRINPGNIEKKGIEEIIACAKANKRSLRIGVNSGSIPKQIIEKYGGPSVDAIVESALLSSRQLLDLGFEEFKISVKSSNVKDTINAYRKLFKLTEQPLHIGLTEAGTVCSGTIKSAIAIGSLLADGIGDTIRVSLSTKDIVQEIKTGQQILKSLNLLENTVNIISCPTCARTLVDVVGIAQKLESLTEGVKKNLTISIMGCVVNGPGEAKSADIGIFGFSPNIAKVYCKKNNQTIICTENEIIDYVLEKIT
jgi:(E)-4-hydroxy-3-methylbut-2-enyl-diphosphate synthase